MSLTDIVQGSNNLKNIKSLATDDWIPQSDISVVCQHTLKLLSSPIANKDVLQDLRFSCRFCSS